MWASEVRFACLTWLYGLFVRTLISHTNAYAGCARPILNSIERFDLGPCVPTAKLHFTSCQSDASRSTVCTDYVELFSMNVNLKMFCILCLCILFYATQVKCQKIWLLFWNKVSFCRVFLLSSLSVVWVQWRSKTVEQITLDLFQNCDVPEEVSVTFDPDYQFVGNWYFAKWLNRVSVMAYWRRYPTAQITHKLRPGFSITRLVAV